MKPGINPFVPACLRSAAIAAITLCIGYVQAAVHNYTIVPNTSPGSAWSGGSGWDLPPASGTDTTLNFISSGALAAGAVNFTTNDLSPFLLNRLNFTPVGPASGAAPVITISGNSLEFRSNGGTTPILNFAATGTSLPVAVIENNLILTNNIAIQGASNATLSGVVSGGGTITKTGAGVVTLTNALNSFSGAMTINGGALSFSNAGALQGTNTIVVGAGGSLGLSGITAGSGKSVTINGTGFASTGGLTSFGTAASTWEGNVVLGSASRIGAGTGTPGATDAGSLTVTGTVSGSAELGIRSSNAVQVVTLTGANTYTGPTRIIVGVLSVGQIGNVNSGPGNLGAPTTVTNGTITLGAGASNSPVVIPTLRYTGSGEVTSRVINLESGAPATGTGVAVTATLSHTGTGTLEFTSDLTSSGSGTKTLTLSSAANATGIFSGVIGDGSGGLLGITKSGSGLWTLRGNNSYSGTTNVSGGTLLAATSTALGNTTGGTVVGASGLLQLMGGVTISGESLSLAPKGSGITLQSLVGTSEWTGPITTTVNASSLGDNTRISADTGSVLRLTGPITGNASGSSTFNLGDALTAIGGSGIVFTGTGEIVSTGVISGAMSVISTNAGTVKIQGTENTYTGQTRIQSGIIEVSSLKNIGTASSLGNPLAAQAHILLQGSNVGLRYVGTGDTTDRPIALAAGSTPNIIDQSGSGTLNLTADLVNLGTTGAQAKTLTLTGSGNGVFSGDLVNAASGSSVALSVTKTGSGTWTLSGDGNNYTGTTTVSGGTFKVGGAGINSSTQVNINSGGALDLIAAGVIGNTAAIAINSGRLIANGNPEALGALTIAAGGGMIELLGTNNELRFAASASAWTGNLAIFGWSGAAAGGGEDEVYFGTTSGGLNSGQVSRISFVDPTIDGIAYSGNFGAAILTTGEIVAVIPEPTVTFLGSIGALGLALRRRRTDHR